MLLLKIMKILLKIYYQRKKILILLLKIMKILVFLMKACETGNLELVKFLMEQTQYELKAANDDQKTEALCSYSFHILRAFNFE